MLPSPAIPDEVFAAEVHSLVAWRDWDMLPEFRTLTWNGKSLGVGTLAVLADVPPQGYPQVIKAVADREIAAQLAQDEPDLAGFALVVEVFAAPVPDAPDERDRLYADAAARRVHARPDAVEMLLVHVADLQGRIWSAMRRRDTGTVTEAVHPTVADGPSGTFPRALRDAAACARTALRGATR